MSSAFLDATVVCNAIPLPGVGPASFAAATAALKKYSETEMPFYALRELRSGPLGYVIAFHNLLVVRKSIDEAVEEFRRQTAFMPRKWASAAAALSAGYQYVIDTFKKSPAPPASLPDTKTQLENSLALQILKAWDARKTVAGKVSQPLGCWVDSDLVIGADRQIRLVTGGGDGCVAEARCSAAKELKSREAAVQILIDALHPSKVTAKPETAKRRKALKEVLTRPAADFNKRHCRQLGDAYYCVMSPAGSDILTTNISDFAPMASALKKVLASP